MVRIRCIRDGELQPPGRHHQIAKAIIIIITFIIINTVNDCWRSGVAQWPATGGYVGTVCGDLLHLTQDVSVY